MNVEINFDPVPEWVEKWGSKLPVIVPVVSSHASFYLDFHILTMGRGPRPVFQVHLRFTGLIDRIHSATLAVDVDQQMGPNLGSASELKDLERAVAKVADAINRKK